MNTCFRILAMSLGLQVAAVGAAGAAPQDEAPDAQVPVPAQSAAADRPNTDPMQQIPHTLMALEEAKAGKYGTLKRDDRRRLDAADQDIQTLMQRNPDLSTLNDAERVQLFNAQETIIATVNGLKRSQLVCTYRQQPGTRFKTKHCMSRDMAEAAERAARESTHTAQRDLCVAGENNPCG